MAVASSIRRVLFEPWGLGDALIAAATLRHLPADTALACHSRWHPLLRAALNDLPSLELIPVDLAYTSRSGQASELPAPLRGVEAVLSIRGDLRDWWAARRMFPRARIQITGWLEFIARRVAIVDHLYAAGWLSIASRYRCWSELAGIPFSQVKERYRARPASNSAKR